MRVLQKLHPWLPKSCKTLLHTNMEKTKLKLHIGDTVTVITGKDRGKTNTIEAVYPKEGKVAVVNVNEVKRHVKSRGNQKGGIITVTRPILASKVMLVCPACNRMTRVGYKGVGKGKQRVCKQCGVEVSSGSIVKTKKSK